jgi:hypothetical protein
MLTEELPDLEVVAKIEEPSLPKVVTKVLKKKLFKKPKMQKKMILNRRKRE